MPLYEYRCLACGEEFECLVRGSEVPTCPQCSSVEMEKVLSTFSVSSEDTRRASLKVAKKKSQQTARDKSIADAEEIRNHHH